MADVEQKPNSGLRMLKFIEEFDKGLEAAGFNGEQRLKIVATLMDTKVDFPTDEKEGK